MIFRSDQIAIEIMETEGSIALFSIGLPIGTARVLCDIRFEGNILYVDRAHVEGLTLGVLEGPD